MCSRLIVLIALTTASPLVMSVAVPGSAHAQVGGSPRDALVNIAVDAAALASSETADHPGRLATDGNAATAWCPASSPGMLTIDLGRVEDISGFGITLSGSAPTTTVEISLASSPHSFLSLLPTGKMSNSAPNWVVLGDRAHTRARYVRITLSGDASQCVGELRVLGGSSRAPTAIGHDLSFAVQEAAIGSVYSDRGRVAPPEQILADHGANFVRLRLWLDPPGGYSNLASVLAMAQRARAAGMQILLDFHYSDFWADPGKQNTPAAWQAQDLTALANTVRTYSRDVLAALAAQGTPAAMVQIGNEIRNGMLWPLGWADAWSGAGWGNLGTLLRAAAAGVAEAPGPTPRIVVHFDQGGDNAFARAFFDRVVEQKVPFDVIGLSYYPFWHGTITQLRGNLADLATRYSKDVMIVETQYGWTLNNGDSLGNFLWEPGQVIPGYPVSPDGQLAFVSDLVSALAAVPGGRGAGIFYWQPEWIPGVGWTPGEGTPNDNLTMFDFSGRVLPSAEFINPLRACRQFAPGQSPCTF